LPNKLFDLRELYRLDVSYNLLTAIDNFAELTALRFLDVSHNEFDVLPLDITMTLLGYPYIILYPKFDHFWIILF